MCSDVSQEPTKRATTTCPKSPRGDFGHVVVARFVGSCDTSLHKMMLTDAGAFRLVHDPHPSSEFLDEGEACGWAMFFSERN